MWMLGAAMAVVDARDAVSVQCDASPPRCLPRNCARDSTWRRVLPMIQDSVASEGGTRRSIAPSRRRRGKW